MEEEKVLNAALIKKIAQFLRKVLPEATSSTQQQQPLVPVEIDAPSLPGTPEAVPTAAASGEPTQPSERSAIEEEEAVDFTKRKFGKTASPYLVPYIYDKEFLDRQYGIRKSGDHYMVGDSNVSIDHASDIYVKNRRFKGTEGLWELLTRKNPNLEIVAEDDYKNYKSILLMTNGHLEHYRPDGNIQISRGNKYRNVISKLFQQSRRRGVESALNKRWAKF
jgi:hypothetical protein